MSRLGGAGAVAPLVTDIPLSSVEVLNMKIMFFAICHPIVALSRTNGRRYFF